MNARLLAGMKFLIVEDDVTNAAVLSCMLQSLGARVTARSYCPTDAILLVKGKPNFDLAVVNYRLGDETCIPILKELDAHDLPYLIVTGAVVALLPEALSKVTIVIKPYDVQTLVHAIAEVLQRRSEQRCPSPYGKVSALKPPSCPKATFADYDDLQEAAE